MIKKTYRLILTIILILFSFLSPTVVLAENSLIELFQERTKLSFLADSDVDMLVFYSEYDYSKDTKINYNISAKQLMEKFNHIEELYSQANVSVAYFDSRKILREMKPNDFYYMMFAYKLAGMGFFSLAQEAVSKVKDLEIWVSHIESIKRNMMPAISLTVTEEIFMSELISNIKYKNLTEESINRLQKSDKTLYNSDYALYIRALAYFTEKKYKKALSEIEKAIFKNPDNINYIKSKSEILNADGAVKEALKTIDDIYEKDLIFIETEKSIDKIKYYILSQSGKNENENKYNLAYYFYLNKDYQRAIKELSVLVAKGEMKKSPQLLGKIYLLTGKTENAEKLYEKCILKNKRCAFAYKGQGDILLSKKEYEKALEKYKIAYKYNKKDYDILVALIVSAIKTDNKTDKYKYIVKLKKSAPKNFKTLYLCSKITGDTDNHLLKSALKRNPFYPDGWLDLAQIAYNNDRIEEMERYVNTTAFLTKNNPRYFYYKSLVNSSKNDIQTALADIKQAKKLSEKKEYDINEQL